ncbi:DUF2167 domain-containing protein [Sphingomonas panacisoli]|uniref:DUF2167 domain-containing protein n=1 Tax=Sphingomonas panacisoli TaxID=1813879 RepID=A0A5B8LFM0_9SPHN|nr:DUF2167 domain-containing protein [Sphingomonas panacisoli]QDZ06545.1 DUF2167 domain-containing protein [Sphingomonas panacisoli]
MKKIVAAGALLLAASAIPAGVVLADPVPAAATASPADQAAFVKTLHKQTGDVTIPTANAVLHLGNKYYFLGPDEAKKVLVDLWGNPPSSVSDVLGLVMPADKSVLENSWGAVITWDDSGYVTDDDADSADYDKIMADMKAGEGATNEERQKAGYPLMHMVGWAQPPSYDKATHSLVWARDFSIVGDKADSLNYDVRILGRKGVLSMNMLWDMPHLAEVRTAAQDFGKVATFASGSTYAEYNSSTDKAAGYGLAGLVGLGVGVAVAKKVGLLALLLPFLKWIAVGALALWGAFKGFVGRLFGRKSDTLEG